ncbi:ExbD/TolR family protein [Kiritimatiella glycovorans]|uniref:Protein TolR n=1 Tax=Kiritimatiella glycovorans TaxID=1307763 RepID=A0A0G3EGH0_9BACT|nr:biopolymer transporter ExbD [Kiritimatiella glycovorans]AKJ65566.1 protein TolR [Kiritimatiella glycovorans]
MEIPTYNLRHELRRHFLRRRRTQGWSIFATAVFDAALLLVAFQFLTAPYVLQPGMRISLPEAPFADGAKFDAAVLTVTREGWIFFDDERVTLEGLSDAFARRVQADPETELIVEADRNTRHARLTEVFNRARAAGIRDIVIATRQPSEVR